MLKRITALTLAIFLLLSFAGCSPASNGPTPAYNATQATQATETPDKTEVVTTASTDKPTSSTKANKATTAKATTAATKASQATTKATATKATVKPTVATKAPQTTTKATTATTAATAATKDVATKSTSAQIETDEKLFSVDITLPASMFEGEDMSKFDAKAYAKEQGFTSAKLNADGSVSVTMTKAKHKELLDEMATSLDKNFQEFVNGEDTPYIKEISHNDNFTAVTMKVDKAAYENAFDFTPFAIAVSVSMYQAFTETEYHVEITIVDVATGATIDSITYPDALNG